MIEVCGCKKPSRTREEEKKVKWMRWTSSRQAEFRPGKDVSFYVWRKTTETRQIGMRNREKTAFEPVAPFKLLIPCLICYILIWLWVYQVLVTLTLSHIRKQKETHSSARTWSLVFYHGQSLFEHHIMAD